MPDFGRRAGNGGEPSLNEINRADQFFEALAAKQTAYPTDRAEAELAFLFSGFRDDVRDAPLTATVTAADAVAALRAGQVGSRGPRRGFAIVGSVAAAMLCIGGFGTAVYGAGPGDSLYGMHTALFGQQEQTRDDQVSLASAQLQQVQQLIDQGQWEQAQDKLVQVSSAVQDVDRVESKQQLVEQWNALTYKVVEQNPAATLAPGEPLPVLPSSPLTWLPVPVVEATTTESSATSATSTTSAATTTPTSSPSTSPTTSDTSATESGGPAVPPETPLTTSPPSTVPTSTPASSSPSTSTTTSAPTVSASAPAPSSSSPPPAATTTVTTSAPSTRLPVAPPPPSSTSVVAEAPLAPSRAAATASSSIASSPVAPVLSSAVSQPASTTVQERPVVTPSTTVVPQAGS